jgi:hypothetical protein
MFSEKGVSKEKPYEGYHFLSREFENSGIRGYQALAFSPKSYIPKCIREQKE